MTKHSRWAAVLGLLCLAALSEAHAQSDDRPFLDIRIERADLSFEELQRLVPALEVLTLPDDAVVERLQASGPLTELSLEFVVRAGESTISGTAVADVTGPARTVRGSIRFGDADLAHLLGRAALPRDLTGTAEVDLVIEPSDGTQAVRGTYAIEAERVTLGAYAARDVRLRGRVAGRALDVESLRGRIFGADLRATAHVTLPSDGTAPTYDASGRLTGLNPRIAGRALGIAALDAERFDGAVNASFDVTGAGGEVGPVSLAIDDARLAGGTIPELRAVITPGPGAMRFSADGRFTDLDVGAVADGASTALTGSAQVDGAVERTASGFDWDSLTLEADVRLTEGMVGDVSLDQAIVSGRLDGRIVSVQTLTLEGEGLQGSLEGTLALDGTTETALTYRLDLTRVERFRSLVGGAKGDVRLAGGVTGTDTLLVKGTIEATDVAYGGLTAASLGGTYAVMVPPGQPTAVTGEASLDGTTVRLAGRTLDEASVDADIQGDRVEFEAVLTAEARTVEAAGSLDRQSAVTRLSLSTLRLASPEGMWAMPASRGVDVEYADGRLVVRGLRLEGPEGQAIDVDGSLGRAASDGRLDISAQGLVLSDLDAVVRGDRAPLGMEGRLDARATVSGPLDGPQIDAEFTVLDGILRGYRFESLSGTIETAPGGYRFMTRLQQDPASWLTAEGMLPPGLLADGERSGPRPLDVTVRSSPLGLGFVGGLTDAVSEVEGTLEANVQVSGTIDEPAFDGRVTIRGGALSVPRLGARFTGLDTEILFEPDAMLVPELRVLDEHGEWLRIEGRLPYAADRAGEVRLLIDSENFEIIDNDLADVQIRADLAVSGSVLEPAIEGTIEVVSGQVFVDHLLDLRGRSYYRAAPIAGDGAEIDETADPAGRPGILEGMPVALDVRLDVPVLTLVGRDLRGPASSPIGLGDVNVTVGGYLTFEKRTEEPLVITGDVTTIRGTYQFQGRRFDILREGRNVFPGLAEIDPLLDLTAERTISGVETRVTIGGTLRRPEVMLSSQPPLDEADILSLIVFNQPVNQLGASEQVSLGRRAASLATGFVTTRLTQSVSGALDLDLVELDAGGDDVQGLAPSVTLGEQIGQNLFLKVRQQFGPASASQLVLEYEFADWMRLQSTVSDERGQSQSLFRRGERSGVNWIFDFSY